MIGCLAMAKADKRLGIAKPVDAAFFEWAIHIAGYIK